MNYRILLFCCLLLVVIGYFSLFIKSKKVKESKYLKIEYSEGKVHVSTMESFKYIEAYTIVPIDSQFARIDIYTTTIYNPFSLKKASVDIEIDNEFKKIIIAGQEVKLK